MQLIHPIYLDVPMLVSFVAAIEGGVSLEADITEAKEADRTGSAKIGAKLGLNSWLTKLVDATTEAEVSGEVSGKNQETRHELRSHTEASIAILLYDKLLKNKEYLLRPNDMESLAKVNPGTLVEVAGIVEKNAVDTMIDIIDSAINLSNMGPSPISQAVQASNKHTGRQTQPLGQTQIERIRETLDADRKRTPISNILLRCTEPKGVNVVITLRRANLRDLTLAELNKNSVRVIGKITRTIDKDQSMSAFENYGMALIAPSTLEVIFKDLANTEGIVAQFSEVQIKGPAVQILPLMIFV